MLFKDESCTIEPLHSSETLDSIVREVESLREGGRVVHLGIGGSLHKCDCVFKIEYIHRSNCSNQI